MEFKNFLYVQVSITLYYFLFELGFIQIFLHNIPSISGIWYLISDICLCKTEYFCPSFSNYSQTSIEIFSYISIQFLFLYTYSKSRLPCLAIDRSYTSRSLYARLCPIQQSWSWQCWLPQSACGCASKRAGVLFNLVLHHFVIKYYFQNVNL